MSDIVIHDFPGKHVRRGFIAADGMRSQSDLARSALDALFLFSDGIYEPIAMDLQVACCDRETGYPISDLTPRHPFWLFRRRELTPGLEIRPAWTNEEIVIVDRLDLASILDCLKAPLGQNCNGEGCEVG